MNQKLKNRLEAIEKRVGQTERRVICLLEGEDGTVSEFGKVIPPDPSQIKPGDMVIWVSSPPWDPIMQRRLTNDEMEAKFPGRQDRLAKWKAERPGSV